MEAAWDSGIRYFDTAPHYGSGAVRASPRCLPAHETARAVCDLDEGRPAAATEPRRRRHHRPRARLRRPRRSAPGVGLHRRRYPAQSGRIAGAIGSGCGRHPVPARSGRVRPDRRRWRPGCRRWPNCGPRVRSGPPASGRSPPPPCSPRSGPVELDLLMVAGRYTLLEQPAALEVLPECRSRGVGVIAAAVFNSGVLARPVPTAGDRYEYGAIPDELLARVRRIADGVRAVRGRAAHRGHAVRAARPGGDQRRRRWRSAGPGAAERASGWPP